MHKYFVPKEHNGKSLYYIIQHMGREKEFEWNPYAYIVSLDDSIIPQNFMQRTFVSEGQIVRILPVTTGG